MISGSIEHIENEIKRLRVVKRSLILNLCNKKGCDACLDINGETICSVDEYSDKINFWEVALNELE